MGSPTPSRRTAPAWPLLALAAVASLGLFVVASLDLWDARATATARVQQRFEGEAEL